MLGQKVDRLRGRRPGLNIPRSSKWKHCWHHNRLLTQPVYRFYGILKMGKTRRGKEESDTVYRIKVNSGKIKDLYTANKKKQRCKPEGYKWASQRGLQVELWDALYTKSKFVWWTRKKEYWKAAQRLIKIFKSLFLSWVTVAWVSSPSLMNRQARPQQCAPLLRVLRDSQSEQLALSASQSSSAHPYVSVLHNASEPAQQWAVIAG